MRETRTESADTEMSARAHCQSMLMMMHMDHEPTRIRAVCSAFACPFAFAFASSICAQFGCNSLELMWIAVLEGDDWMAMDARECCLNTSTTRHIDNQM